MIQLGPKSVLEKNIWPKSNETIHAFKLYFSFYETGKDGRLDNCGNEFRNHLLFVGSPMLLVSKILLKLRFNWIHNCSGNQLKRENCVSCGRDPNKVVAEPIRVDGVQQVPTKILLYHHIIYHYEDYIILPYDISLPRLYYINRLGSMGLLFNRSQPRWGYWCLMKQTPPSLLLQN